VSVYAGAQRGSRAWPPTRGEVTGPWTPADFTRAAVVAGVGLVGTVVCWHQGSGELTYGGEVPWLVGSIASAGVIVLGLVSWLVAGFRTVRLEEHALLCEVVPLVAGRGDVEELAMRALAESEAGPVQLVTSAGMTRVHRGDCAHMRGKPVEPVSPAQIASRGLTPCGVCHR
jgi:hypothetical protein